MERGPTVVKKGSSWYKGDVYVDGKVHISEIVVLSVLQDQTPKKKLWREPVIEYRAVNFARVNKDTGEKATIFMTNGDDSFLREWSPSKEEALRAMISAEVSPERRLLDAIFGESHGEDEFDIARRTIDVLQQVLALKREIDSENKQEE